MPAGRTSKAIIPFVSLAAAAALAALIILPQTGKRELKDTYDDPYLAYAEVEKVFQNISGKMALGVDLVKEVRPTAEKPIQVLEKINRQ